MKRDDLEDQAVLGETPDNRTRRSRLLERDGPTVMAAWYRLWDDAEYLCLDPVRSRSSFDLEVTTPCPYQRREAHLEGEES